MKIKCDNLYRFHLKTASTYYVNKMIFLDIYLILMLWLVPLFNQHAQNYLIFTSREHLERYKSERKNC